MSKFKSDYADLDELELALQGKQPKARDNRGESGPPSLPETAPPAPPGLRTIDLLKEFETASSLDQTALERIRLGASEIAIIPFTAEAAQVEIHYCEEPDINDYVICNGVDCYLCKIGREKVTRHLLPVFLPGSHAVGVLPVPTSLRPRSLWPQLAQVLKGGLRKAVFVSRVHGDNYTVTAVPLQGDVADGAEVIKTFLEDHQKGAIQLDSVFPKVTNEQLAAIPEIDRMLKLKGIKVG